MTKPSPATKRKEPEPQSAEEDFYFTTKVKKMPDGTEKTVRVKVIRKKVAVPAKPAPASPEAKTPETKAATEEAKPAAKPAAKKLPVASKSIVSPAKASPSKTAQPKTTPTKAAAPAPAPAKKAEAPKKAAPKKAAPKKKPVIEEESSDEEEVLSGEGSDSENEETPVVAKKKVAAVKPAPKPAVADDDEGFDIESDGGGDDDDDEEEDESEEEESDDEESDDADDESTAGAAKGKAPKTKAKPKAKRVSRIERRAKAVQADNRAKLTLPSKDSGDRPAVIADAIGKLLAFTTDQGPVLVDQTQPVPMLRLLSEFYATYATAGNGTVTAAALSDAISKSVAAGKLPHVKKQTTLPLIDASDTIELTEQPCVVSRVFTTYARPADLEVLNKEELLDALNTLVPRDDYPGETAHNRARSSLVAALMSCTMATFDKPLFFTVHPETAEWLLPALGAVEADRFMPLHPKTLLLAESRAPAIAVTPSASNTAANALKLHTALNATTFYVMQNNTVRVPTIAVPATRVPNEEHRRQLVLMLVTSIFELALGAGALDPDIDFATDPQQLIDAFLMGLDLSTVESIIHKPPAKKDRPQKKEKKAAKKDAAESSDDEGVSVRSDDEGVRDEEEPKKEARLKQKEQQKERKGDADGGADVDDAMDTAADDDVGDEVAAADPAPKGKAKGKKDAPKPVEEEAEEEAASVNEVAEGAAVEGEADEEMAEEVVEDAVEDAEEIVEEAVEEDADIVEAEIIEEIVEEEPEPEVKHAAKKKRAK